MLGIERAAGYFTSCRFITIMYKCLKVPAKNSPALLFLSRGKEEERKKTTITQLAIYMASVIMGTLALKNGFYAHTHD